MTNPDPFQTSESVELPAPVPAQDRIPGPDHSAAAVKPNAPFWRTLLQVGPAAALGLLLILPAVLQDILDAFGQSLPPGLYAVLAGITAAVTLIAGILAKLMARPDVQGWLAKYLPLFATTKK